MQMTAVYCTFRITKERRKKGLWSVEEFEKELREEISVSVEFDLPLALVLALNVSGKRRMGTEGRARGARRYARCVMRVADLVAQSGPEELLVSLPNTTVVDTRGGVEEGLREVVPEAISGVATYREGGKAEQLCSNARAAAR